MPEEERRISPGVVILVGLGLAGLLVFTVACAAPPKEYICPYCGVPFATYEELVAHVTTEHPGERIPLPIEWE